MVDGRFSRSDVLTSEADLTSHFYRLVYRTIRFYPAGKTAERLHN